MTTATEKGAHGAVTPERLTSEPQPQSKETNMAIVQDKYTEAEIAAHRPAWADVEKSDIAVGEKEDNWVGNALWVAGFEIGSDTHGVEITQLDLFGGGETDIGVPRIDLSIANGSANDQVWIYDASTAREVAFALFAAAAELDRINGIEVSSVSYHRGDDDDIFEGEKHAFTQIRIESGLGYKHYVDDADGEWKVSYVAPRDDVTPAEARELLVRILDAIAVADRLNREAK